MDISESNFCCGLNELGQFPEGNTEKEFEEELSYEGWDTIEKFFYDLVDDFCLGGSLICTVSMKSQRYMYELLTAVGFQEVKRWKSNHGDYELVMFIN